MHLDSKPLNKSNIGNMFYFHLSNTQTQPLMKTDTIDLKDFNLHPDISVLLKC